jgi:hypothetical protein
MVAPCGAVDACEADCEACETADCAAEEDLAEGGLVELGLGELEDEPVVGCFFFFGEDLHGCKIASS